MSILRMNHETKRKKQKQYWENDEIWLRVHDKRIEISCKACDEGVTATTTTCIDWKSHAQHSCLPAAHINTHTKRRLIIRRRDRGLRAGSLIDQSIYANLTKLKNVALGQVRLARRIVPMAAGHFILGRGNCRKDMCP